ncbi:hypothetical protein U9M48_001047 [Paspalum notatum var. saurae]|uniref:Uncharacterized protein n=1 Tax=Paspalum notatum var. saurae TaxID=547442 RepID=A0AAQ3PHL4_PASNO
MASAAILRSAARSLRLLQPLEQQRCLLARRFSSSSTPSEGLDVNRVLGIVNGQVHQEDIVQRILRKIDMVSDNMDKQARLIKQIEAKINEHECERTIDLTSWVLSIPTTFLIIALYNK